MTLADLFEGRSQLIVVHFMWPEWEEGWPELLIQDGPYRRRAGALAQRDVSFVAISRAPISKVEGFGKRMGWKFNWVWHRVQLRLLCLVHSRGSGKRQARIQPRSRAVPKHRSAGIERLLYS